MVQLCNADVIKIISREDETVSRKLATERARTLNTIGTRPRHPYEFSTSLFLPRWTESSNSESVSYTHLDVYKRQEYYRSRLRKIRFVAIVWYGFTKHFVLLSRRNLLSAPTLISCALVSSTA